MMNIKLFAIVILFFPAYALAAGESGQPVPRWVSLKSNEVNVRTGPGTRYPIQWIYRRDAMPVEVIEEFDLWRKVRDVEGATGWIHKSMLQGRRTIIIKSGEAKILRTDPTPDSRPVVKAQPLVIGQLMECKPLWCRIQVDKHRGWLEKKFLWGVYAAEENIQ